MIREKKRVNILTLAYEFIFIQFNRLINLFMFRNYMEITRKLCSFFGKQRHSNIRRIMSERKKERIQDKKKMATISD